MSTSIHPNELKKRLTFLQTVPLFTELDKNDLKSLAETLRRRTFHKGEIVFHQGDQSDEMFLVQQGKVRIFHLSLNGEETTVNILTRRHLVGEFAMIDGSQRSATAKALTTCTLLQMTREAFLWHLQKTPGFALAMCQQLVKKVRWTSVYAETIAQFDAAGRLLHMLLLYKDQFGIEKETGKRYVLDLGLNQTDLATLIGGRRGWVNRILQRWRKQGLVEYKKGQIIILDLPKLIEERDSRMGDYG